MKQFEVAVSLNHDAMTSLQIHISRGCIDKKILLLHNLRKKASMCFFSKIDSYKVHSYKKQKSLPTRWPPTLPILLNGVFPKIDPLGTICLPLLAWARGSGFIVAWGHHLRMQLQSQNHALVFPRGRKAATATLFSCNDDDKSYIDES